MSALIDADTVAVEYVKKFRGDLWQRYRLAFEQQRPLSHEERVRDARAVVFESYNHRVWPREAIHAFGGDWRKL